MSTLTIHFIILLAVSCLVSCLRIGFALGRRYERDLQDIREGRKP